jgi:hypothetical protein
MWNKPFVRGVREWFLWNFVVAAILPTLCLLLGVAMGKLSSSNIYSHGELFAIGAVLAANNFRVHHRLAPSKESHAWALGGTIVLFSLGLMAWILVLSGAPNTQVRTAAALPVTTTTPSALPPGSNEVPTDKDVPSGGEVNPSILVWGGLGFLFSCVMLGAAVAGAEAVQSVKVNAGSAPGSSAANSEQGLRGPTPRGAAAAPKSVKKRKK